MASKSIETRLLREAVIKYIEENNVNWSSLCVRLGWLRKDNGGAEVTRLKRALGMTGDKKRGKEYDVTLLTRNTTAVKIIRVIDRAPWEFGL